MASMPKPSFQLQSKYCLLKSSLYAQVSNQLQKSASSHTLKSKAVETKTVLSDLINDVFVAKGRKLANAKIARYQAVRPTGLACFEPCSFPNCTSSCGKCFDDPHIEHFCSDHSVKVKPMTQQIALPTLEIVGPAKKLLAETVPEMPEQDDLHDEEWDEPSVFDTDSEGSNDTETDILHQQAREVATGQLDFDYLDVNSVLPSAQLKNRIKSSINTVWEVMSEEYMSHG